MSIIRKIIKYWLNKKQKQTLRRFRSCGDNVSFANHFFLINPQLIDIGEGSSFSDGLVLTAWDKYIFMESRTNEKTVQKFSPSIIFGRNCSIGRNNHITAIDKIKIGDNLLTGQDVTITDNSHGDCSLDDIATPPFSGSYVVKDRLLLATMYGLVQKQPYYPESKLEIM